MAYISGTISAAFPTPMYQWVYFCGRSMKILAGLFVPFLATPCWAQSQSVQQSGSVTASHSACWTYDGVIQDCGTSAIPFSTTFGVYGTGTPACVLNTRITAATINVVPYYKLCFGYSTGSTSGVISLQPFNGAASIPLDLIIDGVTYSFGGSSNWLSAIFDQQFGSTPGDLVCRGTNYWGALSPGGSGQYLQAQSNGCPAWVTPGSVFNNPLRTIATGYTDTASSTDGTIAWNSSSTNNKAETIFACNSGVNGKVLIIKDEKGTAGRYQITITPASGTIENSTNYVLNYNLQSQTIQCDGSTSNWMAE